MRRFIQLARLSLALGLALSACDRGPETSNDNPAPPKTAAARPQDKAPSAAVRVPIQGAKIKGSDRALVTVVEFSDYACPFCKRAHATVETLLGQYGDKVRLAVFENPLPFHTTATPAAKWAFAAGEQGRYWQARDMLFERQKTLDEASLATMAKDLGLDAERLDRDRRSLAADKHVQGSLDVAASLGVTGTPTFFINGVQLVGAQPEATFRAAIDAAMKDAQAMVARGVRPEDVYAEVLKTAAAPTPKAAKEAGRGAGAKADGKPCGAGEDCGCKDRDKDDADEAADAAPVDVELGSAPVRGAANAPVTLVVFTDFQCPYCRKAEATVQALEKAYPGKLRIAYKSAPLPFHEHARLAAKASLAAQRQGKFFEYRDALFEHQDALDREALIGYAATLGLDMTRFRADLDDAALEAAVSADQAQVQKLDVKGTPTFFVNGRRLVGAQPEEAFRKAIDAVLAGR
jgi:protein-disulfide isomerase